MIHDIVEICQELRLRGEDRVGIYKVRSASRAIKEFGYKERSWDGVGKTVCVGKKTLVNYMGVKFRPIQWDAI